jgi:hypothetical protein
VAFDPTDVTRLPAPWPEHVARWRNREHILELPVHPGLFLALGVGAWASLEPVLELLADEPERVRDD